MQPSKCEAKSLHRLLEDTPEAWYWVGFILADGTINHYDKRLKLALATADSTHLLKFNKFISSDNTYSSDKHIETKVKHSEIIPKLITKFDFKPRKTYFPPHLSHFVDELLISLYVGFIDGDGSIKNIKERKDCNLTVKLHESWFNWLYNMKKNLYHYFDTDEYHIDPKVRITTSGYASLIISDNSLLRKMKLHVEKYNLPVLKRKWDTIDLSRTSRYDLASERKTYVSNNYKKLKTKQIAAHLEISESLVRTIWIG